MTAEPATLREETVKNWLEMAHTQDPEDFMTLGEFKVLCGTWLRFHAALDGLHIQHPRTFDEKRKVSVPPTCLPNCPACEALRG